MDRESSNEHVWDLSAVEPPWRAGVSIYEHIVTHSRGPKSMLDNAGARLPDERDAHETTWVTGGLDGAYRRYGGGDDEIRRARMVYEALALALADARTSAIARLYELLLRGAVDCAEPLLELIASRRELDLDRLKELAVWIASSSPDREPVKFAVAALGVVPGSEHHDLLRALGRHEEFTLYVAAALERACEDNIERELVALARCVNGWGRVHLLDRLAATDDPEIKSWMLREGYQAIVYGLVAFTCANAGGLREALERDRVDTALIRGASDIICALIEDSAPSESIDAYDDGALAVERYFYHLGDHPTLLCQLITVDCVARFLDRPNADWSTRARRGWTPALRDRLLARARVVKQMQHWPRLVTAGLESPDGHVFYQADRAAVVIGLDAWEHHLARLESLEEHSWCAVVNTRDDARFDRALARIERILPLDRIAADPSGESTPESEWIFFHLMHAILVYLDAHPGKGWPLIRVGLRVPEARQLALEVLSEWGMANWPGEAKPMLEATLLEDITTSMRADVETLLAGRALEPPPITDSTDHAPM